MNRVLFNLEDSKSDDDDNEEHDDDKKDEDNEELIKEWWEKSEGLWKELTTVINATEQKKTVKELKIAIVDFKAAIYSIGQLLARRLLKHFELNEKYVGIEEAIGEDYDVEEASEGCPCRALLDVGLVRTTTRHRVSGGLKGSLDGSLDIPHGEKRFSRYGKEEKLLNADAHKRYIFGEHVADYMKRSREDESKKYQLQFSSFITSEVEPESFKCTRAFTLLSGLILKGTSF
ncbi:hypothetical protein L7F22_040722 [Adiantum nelumboides]|nr:hypothetical protein [Adiantum nelumboides]